ncbi:MAG: CvpA family protein [Treponema sp.]|nr:CvpA family protein [Treponema sp.]
MNFSPLDLIFILIIVFFTLSALIRGFINEVFGKVSVVLSIGAAIFFSPKFEVYVQQSLQNPILSKAISFILIFIVFFLAIKILQSILSKIFSCSILKSLDRVLGFALGLIEGLIVVAFIVIIFDRQPWFDLSAITKDSVIYEILNFSQDEIENLGALS